ncbi:MAG: outer membrane protein assembly factor BamB family protein [Planctomycetota bacterium]
MKTNSTLIAAMIMLMACGSMADWPQYLGPDRNAVSPETGLLRSWPKAGPKVLWTVSLGAGYGGAAVSDGKAYILDRIGNDKDVLRCLDLGTGKEQWSYEYDAPGRVSHPGSRSTPALDGNYIYTCGSFGDVHCFDRNTHKPVWKKNVWKDFDDGSVPRWAISQNPLIYGDLLILASQTTKAGVVAYDKLSGRLKWASPPLPGRTGYVSPKIVKIAGDAHLVMITAGARGGGGGAVMGMEPKTGKRLWLYEGWSCQIPVSNVTEIGDGRLFVTGGYKAGSAMIKIEKAGDSVAVTEVYKTDDFGTHVHPAILYKGHLYGHCTTNSRRSGMVCMDLDGKVKWKTGSSPLFDKGGFVLADGLIFSVDGKEGILYLIEPSPAGFKPLASVKMLNTRECWGPLTLVDGKLLIRDQEQMKCILVR